jgi:hypothetical protein
MEKEMKMKLISVLFALLVAACAGAPSRTDSQTATFAVESGPYSLIADKCAQWPQAVACTTDAVYVQGPAKRTVVTLKTQHMAYNALGVKCGILFGKGSCYKNGALYTSSNYDGGDTFRMGEIGDELSEAFNLGLEYNRASQLGHEVFVHILGNSRDPK